MTDLVGQLTLASASEGTALADNTTVATFTDANLTNVASDFTATINWGDGTTTTGTVSGANGSFIVTDGHTYSDEGSFPLSATITRADNTTVTLGGATLTVAEADVLTAQPTTIIPPPNAPFSGVVANFTDTDPSNAAGD